MRPKTERNPKEEVLELKDHEPDHLVDGGAATGRATGYTFYDRYFTPSPESSGDVALTRFFQVRNATD